MTRIVGAHFNQKDKLKITMSISKRLVSIRQGLLTQGVFGLNLFASRVSGAVIYIRLLKNVETK